MRVLIFHGYLLGGTGSNVYNARLAEALTRLGHDVHLLCQERHPEAYAFIDAAGDWDGQTLRIRELRAPQGASRRGDAGAGDRAGRYTEYGGGGTAQVGRCTVYRPNIGELLPVYVADRYEGMQARPFNDCSDAQVASYIDANVVAVRELAERVRPHVALANHLVMGPVILARALAGEVPYAVKVHGSALEYTVKPAPERFLALACEGVAGARAILVGSRHTAVSLWEALDDPSLAARTRLGPPGVDTRRFTARDHVDAMHALRALAIGLRAGTQTRAASALAGGPSDAEGAPAAGVSSADESAFARDDDAAGRALQRIEPERDRLVAFVGKLIVSKGVDLLLAAWPLVLQRVPDARLAIVGFGSYRSALEDLLAALSAGELDRARALARAGAALEAPDAALEAPDAALEAPGAGSPVGSRSLRHLLAFLDGLDGEARERYLAAARALGERVLWTGRLEHEALAELLPACEAVVVPSTFPEAFGMVAVEAAACGALPISAAHSGLSEVSDELAGALPAEAVQWLSFPVDDDAVTALAQRVVGWLQADADLRHRTRDALVTTVGERWSWEGVARGVIAAADGELQSLRQP